MADKSSKANQISAPLILNFNKSVLHDMSKPNSNYSDESNSSLEMLNISDINHDILEKNCNILEKGCNFNCDEVKENSDLLYKNCKASNENSYVSDGNSLTETASSDDLFAASSDDLFADIRHIRNTYTKNVIIGHLNVNSVGSKINEIKELQSSCKLDVLVLSETKLDQSFKQEILDIEGYSCVRQDKRSNSGGLMAYISKDIPYSIGNVNICDDDLECLSIELNLPNEKIMLVCMYKNPRTDSVIFKRFFKDACEKITDLYENIIIIGDLNFNMLIDNILSNVMPAFNLTNVIKEATCFKSCIATLIDVMLVTKRRKVLTSFSKSTGISDFHNLVGGVLRMNKPTPKTKKVYVRAFSQIDYSKVLEDLDTSIFQNVVLAAGGGGPIRPMMQYKKSW